jgi:DNA primase
MGVREETQALNAMTVHAVGQMLGLKLPLSGMARCPLPSHNDTTPSFEVRHSGRRWICYRCDQKGGAIDLVIAVRGLSFVDAKRWLADACGSTTQINRPGRAVYGATRVTAAPPSTVLSSSIEAPEPPADHELYAALLERAPLTNDGRDYLFSRGISDATILRFALGQMPNIAETADLIRHFGFARVEAGGLLIRKSTIDHYWPIFPAGSLLFPYFEAGKIVYFQARLIQDNVKGQRWRNLNHRSRRLYNVDVLTQPSVMRVAICEGAMDVISASQLGCEAIGLIGVSARLTSEEVMALRGKQVDLLLDWDEAGDKRAITLRKELARFGVAATRRTAPRCGAKDVNDYLRGGHTSL